MLKSVQRPLAGLALAAAVVLLPFDSQETAAQSSGPYINAVDLDIVPDQVAGFMAAIKENGENAIKEPGVREFNITTLASNPNHVFLFEVYENEAAFQAHRATDHFKKYQATTANMIAKRDARPLSAVALHSKRG
jgi:(4S)-4-hydroxy-5-phosphonooxypentane-2,3-dione isomerase